ncbi:MAG: hypothetical protein ACOX6E_06555 [Syntrophomonadaceae bacterium]|jgi:hypothetical protein
MDNSRITMQNCMSYINEAKWEIENLRRIITSDNAKTEIELAYSSLNDSWNHCNTALHKIQ